MGRILSWVLLLSLVSVSNAFAFPVTHSLSLTNNKLQIQFDSGYRFDGTVSIGDPESGGCSGSIIRFETSKPTDFAMVITNGHCIYEGNFIPAGQFVSHEASSKIFTVLDASGSKLGEVNATELLYGTMTKTDIGLFKLQQTYADIEIQFGVQPYTLASQHPVAQEPIEIISGYWKLGYTCSIEYFVPQLREDAWTEQDSIRYKNPGCEIISGTSGSPILQAGTRTMIGINNTSNENGGQCTMDNPCEIDANGNITAEKGVSYGQETYWIYSCLDADNNLDVTLPGCGLTH